ncbi:MAG: hypothetical protein SH857_05040 [Chitinophagales bacterium]|nr:hypothetical protein [Chitinophagales bacterium]
MNKNIFFFTAITFFSFTVFAQERDLAELLRKDLQKEKATLITTAMAFSTDESAVFWPIYRDYEKSLSAIMDKRLALIQDYANNYEKMTPEKSTEIVNKAFDLEAVRTKLLKKYFKKFSKAFTPTRAARFVQVENQILKLLDVQVAQALPLVY